MATDSWFEKLAQAWSAAENRSTARIATAGVHNFARDTAGASGQADQGQVRVLWVAAGAGSAPPALLNSQADARGNYLIEGACPGPHDDVEALLHSHHPRLLLADVDWCARIGLVIIKRLHRHQPECDWLLRWDEPSPRWIDTLVHCGARGAVLRTADHVELKRAFDAVIAGDLWLSRQVLQWLYATLIDATKQGPHPTLGPSTSSIDSELTSREAEVVALLRQGLTNRDIAARLGVSVNTVKKHVAKAFEKQGIRSRRQTLG